MQNKEKIYPSTIMKNMRRKLSQKKVADHGKCLRMIGA